MAKMQYTVEGKLMYAQSEQNSIDVFDSKHKLIVSWDKTKQFGRSSGLALGTAQRFSRSSSKYRAYKLVSYLLGKEL